MRGLFGWLRRWSLSRRIAAVMVLALVSVQAQAFLQVWLSANPEIRLTGTRWLADEIAASVHAVESLPPDQRPAFLSARSHGLPVRLQWSAGQPWPEAANSPIGARLAATLREMLGADAAVQVAATSLLYMFPIDSLRVQVTPAQVVGELGQDPVRAAEPDVLIPLSLRVAVRLDDGSWVGADPIGFDDGQAVRLVPFTALLAGLAIVGLVSTLMARRIVAPLGRLIDAANTIGTSRELVEVPAAGLGEFAAVARAFEEMQRRLLRFVSERTQMLAAISHDLRSALTRLRIAVETEAAIPAILAEIDDMSAMVDSTLAFASGEAQATRSQPTDIASLLISLLDDFADAGGRCDYQGPDHCVMIGNHVALKRAFANLIDNALKYGAAAHVRLEEASAALRISISDEGPGIPADQVEEAFRAFRRLDPARSGNPGVGLGLTIARDVMQSHGGSLVLHNNAAGSLEVVAELPCR